MRILVTGGAGFIGAHLTRRLAACRAGSITVFDNLRRGSFDALGDCREGIGLVEGDIRDPAALGAAMRGIDIVYHLAAESSVMNSAADPERTFTSNVTGTWNVLRLARECGVRRVIFTSSREVYGDPRSIPVPESAPVEPKNAYGRSKAAAEECCREFASGELQTIVLRLANVYGPGDRGRVIPIFVENALRGEPLVLYGGDQVIDFVWIDAVIDILMKAAFSPCPNGPFNVGSGRGVTVAALARRVVAATGSSSPICCRPSRAIEVSRFVADIARARQVFGLEPPDDPLFGLDAAVIAWGAKVANAAAPCSSLPL